MSHGMHIYTSPHFAAGYTKWYPLSSFLLIVIPEQ
jgi:hypothetical protein